MTLSHLRGTPLTLRTEVSACSNLYRDAQNLFSQLDLSFAMDDLDPTTFYATSLRITGKMPARTPQIEVAGRTWDARGDVDLEVESVEDVATALDSLDTSGVADEYIVGDSILAEAFDLSKLKNIPKHIEKVPYFGQFYEVEHGTVWLRSILDDLSNIANRLTK